MLLKYKGIVRNLVNVPFTIENQNNTTILITCRKSDVYIAISSGEKTQEVYDAILKGLLAKSAELVDLDELLPEPEPVVDPDAGKQPHELSEETETTEDSETPETTEEREAETTA